MRSTLENGIPANAVGIAKRLRGVLKLFIPYFVEASYIRHKYRVDPVPEWYDAKSAVSRLKFAFVQFLPYGLIGPREVHALPPGVKREAGVFAIKPILFEIKREVSMSDDLVSDVHDRVIKALYPDGDAIAIGN